MCSSPNVVHPVGGDEEYDSKPIPLRKRQCRDLPFLACYILFVAAFVSISMHCFQKCYPSYVWAGTDSWGNVCGGDPSSSRVVEDVKGSGDVKADSTYLWRMQCINTTLRFCVKKCPEWLENSSMCSNIFWENGYNFINDTTLINGCDDACAPKRLNASNSIVILNRCIKETLVEGGYVEIADFLTIFSYVIDDIISSLNASGSIFVLILIGSIFMNMLLVRFPKYASLCCYVTSFLMTSLACSYMIAHVVKLLPGMTDYENAVYNNKRLFTTSRTIPYLLTSVFCIFGESFIIYCLISSRGNFSKARGLWHSASLCINENPKILSQPLLTLFINAGATFLSVLLFLSVLGCREIKASATNQYVEFEANTDTWILLPLLLFHIWFLELVGRCQAAILSGTAANWYFKSHNHPITTAFQDVLRYNMGSLAATSFSGNATERIELFLNGFNSTKFLGYFSSLSSISIGVYGELRDTILKCSGSKQVERAVTKAYYETRNAICAFKIGLTCASTSLFLALTSNIRLYIPSVLILLFGSIVWLVVGIFTASLLETIAGLAICIWEDFERNNGDERPYYCDRKVAHLLHNVILPLHATHKGRIRIKEQEERIEIMKQKPSKAHSRKTSVHKLAKNTSRPLEKKSTMRHVASSHIILKRICHVESQLVNYQSPSRENIIPGEDACPVSNQFLACANIDNSSHELSMSQISTNSIESEEQMLEAQPPVPYSLNQKYEDELSANDDIFQPSNNRKKSANISIRTTDSAAFTVKTRLPKWRILALSTAKMMQYSKTDKTNEIKIIKSIKKEDSSDIWDGWW
uniref:choline transporter-like protein 2 n=1 Tax=Styela clava TaxID=7725 RepID=UPI0019398197|nr:choline transporter-like protein 2 [Styela clava]